MVRDTAPNQEGGRLVALNDRQLAFVREYTVDHIGKDAAIRAGYKPSNAKYQASRQLANPEIRAAIDAREAEMADALGMTAQWVLAQLKQLIETAMTPVPKLHQGEPVQVEVDGVKQLITEIDGVVAQRALALAMRHRGMLNERSEITVSGEVEYTLHLDTELKPETTDIIEGEGEE